MCSLGFVILYYFFSSVLMFVFSLSSPVSFAVISHLPSVPCYSVHTCYPFSSDYSFSLIGSHSSSLSIYVWLLSLFFAWSSCLLPRCFSCSMWLSMFFGDPCKFYYFCY
ncbi:hypothetical protein AMECASPLE_039535 [Ameca splendens]|uniref:Uncharacterized protein n=1 Tax=Ameca splendens TaxID=208324 RepID=A0ABV0YKT6_9TELE